MQHYCSRNLTNTTDLLLFWLFWCILSNNMPTDLKTSSRLLSCIRGVVPFQLDHGNVLLIRTTSRVTVSTKNTAQLNFSLLNFLFKELCVPSLYWEMTSTKGCCVDCKDGDHCNLQCRLCDNLMEKFLSGFSNWRNCIYPKQFVWIYGHQFCNTMVMSPLDTACKSQNQICSFPQASTCRWPAAYILFTNLSPGFTFFSYTHFLSLCFPYALLLLLH